MLDNIINDLEIKLKININKEDIVYYKEGTTDSLVFSIDNKYLVKTVDKNEMKAQLEYFRVYKKTERIQKLLCHNNKLGYLCFEFIEGTKFKDEAYPDVMGTIEQCFGIVTNYKPYRYDGYGYLYEDHKKSWYQFLKDEVDYSYQSVKDLNYDFSSVYDDLEKIKKYDAPKYLIHGDFGVHNFLIDDERLIRVIDPMPVVGDILYDFYFAIFSSVKLFRNLRETMILDFLPGDRKYKVALMNVVLFIRMCRCYLHHPDDFDVYLAWFLDRNE